MAFCSGCGTQIPDGTTMCPACSSRTAAPATGAVQGTTGGMTDNVVGMLAYITIIPAIIFLIIAFLLASTIPGLLRVGKRSQTSKMVTLSRSSNRLATI